MPGPPKRKIELDTRDLALVRASLLEDQALEGAPASVDVERHTAAALARD